jgi:hypothetical protein
MISAEWVDRQVGEAADSDTLVRCHGFMDRHGSQWTDADLNGPTRIAMDRRGSQWIDAVPVGDVGGYDGSERDVSFTPDGC